MAEKTAGIIRQTRLRSNGTRHITNDVFIKTFLSLYITLVSPAQASECFNIALPPGAKEFSQPTNLDFVRTSHGYTGTTPGFNIYHSGKNLSLIGPACFVLQQDIVRHVDILGKMLGEPGGSGPMIELFSGDIIMDLNRHAFRSNRASTVIYAQVSSIRQEYKKQNYVFKNGTIDVKGSGIVMNGWQYGGEPHNYRPGPDQIKIATSWYGPNFREFGDTNILLENLIIKSGGLAAYLVGRNNIIRHCRIEVEGYEAIALFGANNQLIDNEIIVKRARRAPPKPEQPPAHLNLGSYYEEYAAIWIRDAPGLVIRGNKITIEGLIPAKEAILLINSPGVVIEDNEVTGASKLFMALDKQSSAHVYNNRKRFGNWAEN